MNYRPYVKPDYKILSATSDEPPHRLRGTWWRLAAVGGVLAVLGILSGLAPLPNQDVASIAPEKVAIQVAAPPSLSDNPVLSLRVADLQDASPDPEQAPEDNISEQAFTVRPGDSLYTIFRREKVPQATLQAILASGKQGKKLSRIRPGQTVAFGRDDDNRLVHLRYQMDETRAVHIRHDAKTQGFVGELVEIPLETREATASGVVRSSLFLAGQRGGLSDNIIMQLVSIFGWDVDFALDIREGDRFTAIYEELYKDGDKVRDGDVVAAEFVNQGRVHRAVRYTDSRGNSNYYTPDGHSMRKAFLRTPVNYSRISSRFSLSRRHPVLHRVRAHKGVDYAAPRGTPIKSTGDGKVIFRGRKGGYGKTVIIRHGATYTTLYAHMAHYNRKLKRGARVKQGQTIGYVGSTGLATGPHLHYEFRVRGTHRNPLTVKLPKAASIANASLGDFKLRTAGSAAQLDLLSRTQVAVNQR